MTSPFCTICWICVWRVSSLNFEWAVWALTYRISVHIRSLFFCCSTWSGLTTFEKLLSTSLHEPAATCRSCSLSMCCMCWWYDLWFLNSYCCGSCSIRNDIPLPIHDNTSSVAPMAFQYPSFARSLSLGSVDSAQGLFLFSVLACSCILCIAISSDVSANVLTSARGVCSKLSIKSLSDTKVEDDEVLGLLLQNFASWPTCVQYSQGGLYNMCW